MKSSLLKTGSIFRSSLRCAALAAAAIFAFPLSAQITAGTLGQRMVTASLFIEDFKGSGIDNGTGLGARLNTPLARNLDFTLASAFESSDTNDFRERLLSATLTTYRKRHGLTPFADLTLGHVWQSSVYEGTKYTDNETFWAAGLGIEAPVSDRTALSARVAYHKYFSSQFGHYWLYTVGFSHWFTPRVSLVGSLSFRDNDSVLYSVGAGFKF